MSWNRPFSALTGASSASPVRLAVSFLTIGVLVVGTVWFSVTSKGASLPLSQSPLQGEAAIAHLKQQGLYNSLREAMIASRYGIQPVPGSVDTYAARNPAHELQAEFSPDGLRLENRAPEHQRQLVMKLHSLGYGDRQRAVTVATLKAQGQRVDYTHKLSISRSRATSRQTHPSIQEWFINRPEGLEQGFTLFEPPAERLTGEPLRLTLEIAGELRMRASNDRQAVELMDKFGRGVLRYDHLKVTDTQGRELRAWMSVKGRELRLVVEDETASYPLTIDPTITQQAYLKASNTEALDRFGAAVAISGDTIVVGAPLEDSNATGINGNQANNTASSSGAAYVFTRSGANWSQQAYLKASNTGASDRFGAAVAISGDTIVIGASSEASNATGVNGDQANNLAGSSGAAYVFTRSAGIWTQQAYLKASNTGAGDEFGTSVAISGDTIVVGALFEESNATGVNGDQANNLATRSGAAYVFTRSGANWSQQAYLKASNTGTSDEFGWSVAVSGDTIVVGALLEDSNATGINGDQANNAASSSGAAYVFTRNAGIWSQQAYLKASNTDAGDQFGTSVAISGDTIVVGALFEDSNATGIDGDQVNNLTSNSGAAYVFTRSAGIWGQQAYLKASNTEAADQFGTSISISGDSIVVGALFEDSNATGVNGDQANNLTSNSGAAYAFALPSSGTLPIISTTAFSPLTRERGAAVINSAIATVSNSEGVATAISVVVNGSATATVNGVTLSNIVNTSGTITADVVADCTASNASFTLTARNGSLTADAVFTVNVTADTKPPILSCPLDITTSADSASCDQMVNYATPVGSDNCGTASVLCNPASGSAFPKGTSTVSCTATDGSGNTANCSFSVTVTDTTPPTMSCPGNLTEPTNAGQCQAVVSYPTPGASDNCSGVGTVTCAPASGTAFQKGSTTVTCTVSDAAGNSTSCRFSVVVQDQEAPTLNCPANITAQTGAKQCSAVVSYVTPTASDNCSGVGTVTCTPASGSVFPKGTTTVTCSALDASGNPATCSFTVMVNDNTPPTIVCPANIKQPTDSGVCSAVVNFTIPAATDNCSGVTVMCSPSSGSTFPKGTTTVSCTATDTAGNQAACSFTVTVQDAQPPRIICPANIVWMTSAPNQTTVAVTYAAPTVVDNCGSSTVVCSPPSASAFPVGTTTVTCTATNSSGNQASCSFTVTVYDVCIQDDSDSSRKLIFNSVTGAYVFTCGTQTWSGIGSVEQHGQEITLTHKKGDRRVKATISGAPFRATASLQSPPNNPPCLINDSSVLNNDCSQ
jgi:hypothetical protein